MKYALYALGMFMVSSLSINSVDAGFCDYIVDKDVCSKDKDCTWYGTGCCKQRNNKDECILRFKDGGCHAKDFCGFKCKDKCIKYKDQGCKWDGDKCLSVYSPETYEYDSYDSGIVDKTDGILAYASSGTKPDVGLRGFDLLCTDGKNKNCATGYPQVAMICGSTRDLSDLTSILSAKSNSIVYGTNDKRIGTLNEIFSKSQTLKSTFANAGVTTKTNYFWTGCDISGKFATATYSCKNWGVANAKKVANVGSTLSTKSDEAKAFTTAVCNVNQQVVCLCPRKA